MEYCPTCTDSWDKLFSSTFLNNAAASCSDFLLLKTWDGKESPALESPSLQAASEAVGN